MEAAAAVQWCSTDVRLPSDVRSRSVFSDLSVVGVRAESFLRQERFRHSGCFWVNVETERTDVTDHSELKFIIIKTCYSSFFRHVTLKYFKALLFNPRFPETDDPEMFKAA